MKTTTSFSNHIAQLVEKEPDGERQKFLDDVLYGLRSTPKFLQSKYFYDFQGDKIFQQIMHAPEYYPYSCELDIFLEQKTAMVKALQRMPEPFDLIELGAGDASKSRHLLSGLLAAGANFSYIPIDISANVINGLQKSLGQSIPGLKVLGLHGEYFDMLRLAAVLSDNRKIVLFLGSNLGNMPANQAQQFCMELRKHLISGDRVMLGIDLVKDPGTILAAYNDRTGYTREFNFNLLRRINRELNGNFDISNFEHYPTYDPLTGSCKSYLISKSGQEVKIGAELISFQQHEPVYMEISQKYTISQVDQMACNAAFRPVQHFFDQKKWFMDSIWLAE